MSNLRVLSAITLTISSFYINERFLVDLEVKTILDRRLTSNSIGIKVVGLLNVPSISFNNELSSTIRERFLFFSTRVALFT